ncbi:MAG: two-component system, OmpR family, phosphate regulon sensor histidine kinase PhoR [Patescibacteria group bacterium]|nr:two-component system, OmpR family, phosphate regulon sensor histidine kinase PhoR [Patescibacteria group bacterium]
MGIKKEPKQASYFWPGFHKQTIILTILSQTIAPILFGVLIISFGNFTINSTTFWIIIGLTFIINSIFGILNNSHSIKPTKDLMAVINHISGQQSKLVVPELNTKRNERTGFRDALQIIYRATITKEPSKKYQDTKSTNLASSVLAKSLDITTCGFVTLDKDHKIIYSNKSAPVHTNSEGLKELDLIFNVDETLESWLDNCDKNAVRAEHTWVRVPNSLPNQEDRRFFDLFVSYEKGAIAETVLILIDRTNIYSVDEENLDFLSFAAHELRGPITVIRGYLDVLEEELADTFKDDQHELFRRLIVSSNRLASYVDNILNTSRYDRRHLKVHLVEDTVSNVYDVISDDMMLRASSQNRLLSTHFPSSLPTIAVDKSSMSEVFSNLIDNAIKYSNEGSSIEITASVAGDFVEISFQDHGIGMPESVVGNLFQKFYRSHRSRETVAGTGIGLYISKAIVESHGGTISVRSEDGKGSTFIVSLPIYSTVADKLREGDNSNENLISEGKGWIKNHSMFRG